MKLSSNEVQGESEDDESEADPLGVALGEEGVRAAGDGAGEAGTLAGLEEDNDRDGESGKQLQDRESDVHLNSILSVS